MQIFHGEDQVQSRNAFLAAKQAAIKTGLNLIELAGGDLTLQDLVPAVETKSLFGGANLVCIDGFFTRRPSNEKKKVAEYLEAHIKEDVLLWDGRDVGVQLKTFPPAVSKKFDLPKHIFRFLDTFSLPDLQACLKTMAAEQLFVFLASHVRKLIQAKHQALSVPAWQLSKINNQASRFTAEKLLDMHQKLLTIDYKSKTSSLGMDMGAALELWVAMI